MTSQSRSSRWPSGIEPGKPWLLITMCLAVLLAQVDTSVVNLAVHSIGNSLGAAVSGLQWVLDAYNLTYAALLLSGGLLADLYGRRRLFLTGAAIFTGGPVLCAAAPNIQGLIAARSVAGAGAAVFFVLSNMAGRLMEYVGARAMIVGGTMLIGLGSLVISATGAGRPIWLAEIGLTLTGLGMGLNTGPLFSVAVAAVPAARSGSAASLINVARTMGATLGVAVLGTVLAAPVCGRPCSWAELCSLPAPPPPGCWCANTTLAGA